jgi:hypothetical protein
MATVVRVMIMAAYTFDELTRLAPNALNSLADHQGVLSLTAEQFGDIRFVQTVHRLANEAAVSMKATGAASSEVLQSYGAVRSEVTDTFSRLEQDRIARLRLDYARYHRGNLCVNVGGWGMAISFVSSMCVLNLAEAGWGRGTIYIGAGLAASGISFAASSILLIVATIIRKPVIHPIGNGFVFSSIYAHPSEQEKKVGKRLDFLDTAMKEVLHDEVIVSRGDVIGTNHIGLPPVALSPA